MKDYFSDISAISDCSNKNYDNVRTFGIAQVSNVEPSPQPNPPQTPVPMPGNIPIIDNVIDLAKETIKCFTDYTKCKEQEKTKRQEIAARLQGVIYQIDADKEKFLKDLDRYYDDRNRLYTYAESVRDKALELGDTEMLKMSLNFVLDVYHDHGKIGNTIGGK